LFETAKTNKEPYIFFLLVMQTDAEDTVVSLPQAKPKEVSSKPMHPSPEEAARVSLAADTDSLLFGGQEALFSMEDLDRELDSFEPHAKAPPSSSARVDAVFAASDPVKQIDSLLDLVDRGIDIRVQTSMQDASTHSSVLKDLGAQARGKVRSLHRDSLRLAGGNAASSLAAVEAHPFARKLIEGLSACRTKACELKHHATIETLRAQLDRLQQKSDAGHAISKVTAAHLEANDRMRQRLDASI